MSDIAKFLVGWLVILLCYFAGESLAALGRLPVPGALLGLFLLLLVMRLLPRARRMASASAQPLLRHMAVLFVPAVLSVAIHWEAISKHSLILAVALIGTTMLSLGLVGRVACYALKAPRAKQKHG